MINKRRSAFVLEKLEPRLLFSADMALLPLDGGFPAADQDVLLVAPAQLDNGSTQVEESVEQVQREVIFIDAGVEDFQQLLDDIQAQAEEGRQFETVLINSNSDGITQISDYLNNQQDISAIHIISHGSNGEVVLGDSSLNLSTLDSYAEAIEGWQQTLTDQADLLFYGCNLASGAEGLTLISSLSLLTGADVAASDDLTGAAALGGDWDLELTLGEIETDVILSSPSEGNWTGILDSITVTTTADTLDGDADTSSLAALSLDPGADGLISLREAIIASNTDIGADTISLNAEIYDITRSGSDDTTGDFDIRDDLAIIGVSPSVTIINGYTSWSTIFEVHDDAAITVSFTNLKIQGGQSTFLVEEDGAGLYIYGSSNPTTVTLTDVWFSGNNAAVGTGNGGAIYNAGNLTIERALIDNNSAEKGGGIYNAAGGNLTMTNVTLSDNHATAAEGGGLYNAGTATINNVTIAFNDSTTQGGGLYIASGTVDMTNSILANNSAGGSGDDLHGTLSSSSYNMVFDNVGSTVFDATNQLAVDPLLGALADNDGNTQTHALLPGSTAIDNADRTLMPTTDQRGFLRSDGTPDIGAYEVGTSAAATADYLDQFNAIAYDGDDGALPWSNDWQEIGESDGVFFSGPGVSVYNRLSWGQGLYLFSTTIGAWREADLSGAETATLSFDWAAASLGASDSITVEISTDGGINWDVIDNFGSDSALQSVSYDISAYIDSDTRIKFESTILSGEFFVDNVQITMVSGAVPINTAPTISGDYTMSATDKNTTSVAVQVSSILADASITSGDADGDTLGIAVFEADCNGTWEYSTDGTSGWTNFGAVDSNAAVLLDETSWVRYVPDGVNAETATFTFRTWDQTTDLASSAGIPRFGDTSPGGGTTAYSNGAASVSINVTDVNDVPTFTSFGGPVSSGNEDSEITVTFGNLAVWGDEADADGTVDAFVVKSVLSGTLKIGTSAGTATAWVAGSNDTLNVTTNAYWTPTEDANGILNAFEVVAQDNDGAESITNVTVQVTVNSVNDAPTLDINTLTLSQGDTVTLDSTMLLASDVDNTAAELTFTITAVTNGHFAYATAPENPITTFTQAEINTPATIVFVHDGGELAPAYDVSVSDGSLSTTATAANISFAGTANGVLWLTMDRDEGSGSGIPGVDSVNLSANDILQMADPNFTLGETTTNGTFSIAFDISNFGTDANINGLHYVTSEVIIGGVNAITLQQGDLLLTSADDNKTMISNGVGAPGGLNVDKGDIFFFRPDQLGDYSVGNFYRLLTDPAGADIDALTLVEKDVWVGDRWLHEGDLLFSRSGGSEDNDIWLLETSALDPTTGGPYTTMRLIEGDDVSLTDKIYGLDILEDDTTIGDKSYDAGTILFSIDSDDTGVDGIGSNAQPVTQYDIAALTVHQTTLVSGTAQADATLMFDGGDVNFDTNQEMLDGFTLTVDVLSTDVAPTLINNNIAVVEDQTTTITSGMLSATDPDDADSGLVFNILSIDGGQFELSGDPGVEVLSFTQGQISAGEVLFVDDGDENAPTFTLNVFDGVNTTTTVDGGINFANTNDAPVAVDGAASGNEDEAITGNVLSNDTDVEGSALTATLVAGPANGTLTLNADGSFSYTSDADWNGSDSFTYTANDGSLDSNIATVTITVDPVNDAPVAVDDAASGNEDEAITGNVLSNDTDVEGSALTATLVAGPANGTLTLNADGSFSYTSDADWNGSDSFTYTANDGSLDSNIATVTITVDPVNDAPMIISSASFTVDEESLYSYTMTVDDVDLGDVLTLSAPTLPGWLSFNTTSGVLSGTPNNADVGNHNVVLRVNDGTVDVDQSFTITVNEVNDAPTAVNDNLSIMEDHALTVTTIADLLNNDSDPEGNSLTLAGFTQPGHGTLIDNGGGILAYTPDSNFSGTDSFDYSISDGQGGTATGKAYVVVAPVGDTPQVENASVLAGSQSEPIHINRNAADGAEVTHFRISGITGGTLYQANGTTQIHNGDYITVAQGQAGVRFTAASEATGGGSFQVEASEDGFSVAAQSGLAISTISITSVPVVAVPEVEPPIETTEEIIEEDPAEEETETVDENLTEEAPATEALPVLPEKPAITATAVTEKNSPATPFAVILRDGGSNRDEGSLSVDGQRLSISNILNALLKTNPIETLKNSWDSLDIGVLSGREYDLVRNSFDALNEEYRDDTHIETAVISSAVATSIGLSAGYVVWMLKGGSLLASVLSSMPAWHLADPLSILSGMQRDDEDDETLESILEDSDNANDDDDDDDDEADKNKGA